jgi:hypothetical protein
MPTITGTYGSIPWLLTDLTIAEPAVTQLLPQSMRTPIPVDAATTANVVLSGYQTIDGVAFSAGAPLVLVKDQTDKRQNGVYTMGGSAWVRGPVPSQVMPTMGVVAQSTSMVPGLSYLSTFLARAGTRGRGLYFFCTSQDPNIPDRTDIVIETLGATLFDWHAQSAEQTIIRDLDKGIKPIKLSYLADLSQLTFVKVCKMLELLYTGGSANSVDGTPDRSERMRKHWQKRYEDELANTTLRTIGQARIKSRSVRIIRGS